MLPEHLRHFIVGASDLPAGEPVATTHPTLVHPLIGSYDLVAARLYTLALDTHRCGVRATRGAVNHLQQRTSCNGLKPLMFFLIVSVYKRTQLHLGLYFILVIQYTFCLWIIMDWQCVQNFYFQLVSERGL